MFKAALAIVASFVILGAAVADANGPTTPVPTFKKIELSPEYWSEGVAFGDINHDGHNDIVSGPFWYEGPDFKQRHEFRPAHGVTFWDIPVDPKDGRPPEVLRYTDNFAVFIQDFNGDGWPDILSIDVPGKSAAWFENPGKKGLHAGVPWKRHIAFDIVNNESPSFGDLLGTSKPVLVFMTAGFLGYATPDWEHPGRKWQFHPVSAPGAIPDERFTHGIGFGDINGDGRNDLLEPMGWWEQPVALAGDPIWKFHRWPFLKERPANVSLSSLPKNASEEDIKKIAVYYKWPYVFEAAQMYAYDVNGDGLADIISSLDAHGYGLAWFEQLPTRDAAGEIQFKPHLIMNRTPAENPYGVKFSQLHAVALVDVDGDGLKDIVTGKRFWAHGRYADEEPDAPVVLYWFKLARQGKGRAEFVPHLIDDDSGVGTQITVGDVDGDGRQDIVVGNKKGTFLFLNSVGSMNVH